MIGSTFGFLLEVVYRSIRLKRLVKPGFLAGPCLPIYGTGATVLYLICNIDFSFISNPVLKVVVLLLIATILMTVIEYIAGFISIKYFKNKLWDYSNQWGNIQGIICPLFSLIWGVCCLLFYYLVFPWIGDFATAVSTNILLMFFVGIYYGVFSIDLAYSLNLMTKIRSYAIKVKELINFDNFKKLITEKYGSIEKKKSFITFKLYSKISNFIEEHKLSKNSVIEISVKEPENENGSKDNATDKSAQ